MGHPGSEEGLTRIWPMHIQLGDVSHVLSLSPQKFLQNDCAEHGIKKPALSAG